ncbi:MAG: hypothetical protein M1816_008210 [Peltula sp. TS41687]|nr:MAG: hypothetical protein M1816_008210 [Peltula sp. TS41687]
MSQSTDENTLPHGDTSEGPIEPVAVDNHTVQNAETGKTNHAAISRWTIGWKTSFLMGVFYLLALIIAIIHLLVFRFLNGKRTDGIPQSYVTTASNILATCFGASLIAALAIAFTQYLWQLMRKNSMKVENIERLFTIRANPFLLLHPAVIRCTPVLFLCAVLVWSIHIATSFPPGALTVQLTKRTSFQTLTVPTFNASEFGNGSYSDARLRFLGNLAITTNSAKQRVLINYGIRHIRPSLRRLATRIMITGEYALMPSPCGSNCLYTVQFEGPYLECNSNTIEYTTKPLPSDLDIQIRYSGPERMAKNGTVLPEERVDVLADLLTTVGPLPDSDSDKRNTTDYSMTLYNMSCTPLRARYTLTNSYENNTQRITYSTTPLGKLTKVANGTPVQGLNFDSDGKWDQDNVDWYRDGNLLAIFKSMVFPLEGSYAVDGNSLQERDSNCSLVESNKGITCRTPMLWETLDRPNELQAAAARNGSIIANTKLNRAFSEYQLLGARDELTQGVGIRITEKILNELLANITISSISSSGMWKVTTNTTQDVFVNVFSFSRPSNLIVPYFLLLCLALPFLILGTLALYQNGVSATDGGFVQILSTTTGSGELQRVAAAGCLGGEENIPKDLKRLKIRFGELIDSGREDKQGETVIRQASFGIDSEIGPLKRRETYGRKSS